MTPQMTQQQIANIVRATCVDGNDFRDSDVPHIVALIMGDPAYTPQDVQNMLRNFADWFKYAAQSDKFV